MKRSASKLKKSTPKKKVRVSKDPHYDRFEIIIERKEKEAKERLQKTIKTDKEKKMADTFTFIDLKTNQILLHDYSAYDEDIEHIFDLSIYKDGRRQRENLHLSDLINFIFTDDVLDKLIDWNVKESPKGLPSVLYGNSDSMLLFYRILYVI